MKRRDFLKATLVTAAGATLLGTAAAQMVRDPAKEYGLKMAQEIYRDDWIKSHPRWPDYVSWAKWSVREQGKYLRTHFITYVPFKEDPQYHNICRQTILTKTDLVDLSHQEVWALEKLENDANLHLKLGGIMKELAFKFPEWAMKHYKS